MPNSSNSFTNHASRKHSALELKEEQKQVSREFKPRFILKSKETPTNRCLESRDDGGYEYDDQQELFRKYEEEKREMERLQAANR